NRIVYKENPVQDVLGYSTDIVVSAHDCGALTDLIMDKAIEQHAKIAVLPCCHDLKTCTTGCFDGWMDKTLAVDTVRAQRLKSKGYKIVTQTIPKDITPKNRLLMGAYLKTKNPL
ncbi:MAG: methyltransferase domain-containing protein, partial [Bacteroidetes bacterium]|nr:methyltransferase domain-containing protein [Bacteroidota bacterium]